MQQIFLEGTPWEEKGTRLRSLEDETSFSRTVCQGQNDWDMLLAFILVDPSWGLSQQAEVAITVGSWAFG